MKNICEVRDCEKYVVTHGLCDRHRKRLERHGHIEQTRPSDWGSREKHPLYSLWYAQRRNLTKYKFCEEWSNDFWVFAAVIQERPTKVSNLRPIDLEKPIGPDNWHWIEPLNHARKSEEAKIFAINWGREDRKRNPRKYKDKGLKKKYGISLDQYEAMLEEQNNVCAICGQKETAQQHGKIRALAVDHCHATGKVRGLLCTGCNTGIGGFKDDVLLLTKAIAYLNTT